MKTKMKLMIAGMILSAGMAMAAVNTEALISDLQAQGYTWIEVKRGPTQIKIEAIKGTTKVETIIDAETGAVLKREVEAATAAEQAMTGVEVQDREDDFIDAADGDDDDGDDGDDEDDGSDDDGSDDDGSDDDGSDDDGSDDDGSDNGGSDDDDDNSGHGGDDDDEDDEDEDEDEDNGSDEDDDSDDDSSDD